MQAQSSSTPSQREISRPRQQASPTRAYTWTAVAVASIWASVLLASTLAPDFVSGSRQEHLPLVGFTAWLWGAIATGIVMSTTLEEVRARLLSPTAWVVQGLGVAGVWLVVLALSVFAPVFVTGTDPTRIPLAAMGAGILGTFGTFFVLQFVRASQVPETGTAGSIEAKLRDLADLRDRGVIAPEDFTSAKADLLRRL